MVPSLPSHIRLWNNRHENIEWLKSTLQTEGVLIYSCHVVITTVLHLKLIFISTIQTQVWLSNWLIIIFYNKVMTSNIWHQRLWTNLRRNCEGGFPWVHALLSSCTQGTGPFSFLYWDYLGFIQGTPGGQQEGGENCCPLPLKFLVNVSTAASTMRHTNKGKGELMWERQHGYPYEVATAADKLNQCCPIKSRDPWES